MPPAAHGVSRDFPPAPASRPHPGPDPGRPGGCGACRTGDAGRCGTPPPISGCRKRGPRGRTLAKQETLGSSATAFLLAGGGSASHRGLSWAAGGRNSNGKGNDGVTRGGSRCPSGVRLGGDAPLVPRHCLALSWAAGLPLASPAGFSPTGPGSAPPAEPLHRAAPANSFGEASDGLSPAASQTRARRSNKSVHVLQETVGSIWRDVWLENASKFTHTKGPKPGQLPLGLKQKTPTPVLCWGHVCPTVPESMPSGSACL